MELHFISPQLDILPPAQRKLWPELEAVTPGFVLYGGTAVALHYGHRQSIDFDFFSTASFDPQNFKDTHALLKNVQTLQMAKDTLSVLLSSPAGEVKLSFFGGLPFGRVEPPRICKDGFVRLASPLDLAVQKLKVIMVRSEVKDYLDLDCLLARGVRLDEALGAAETLYPGFPTSVAVRALCYFEEGDVPTLNQDVRNRLITQARDLKQIVPIPKDAEVLDLPAEFLQAAKAAGRQR